MSGSQICVKTPYLLLRGHASVKNYSRSMQIDEAEREGEASFPSDEPACLLSAWPVCFAGRSHLMALPLSIR